MLAAGKISASTIENIRIWLTQPHYAEYAPLVLEHIAASQWQELDDVFWTTIPFGTAGRRGRMYPIGTNAINDRTMGESAQGLADYVSIFHSPMPSRHSSPHAFLGCAIAYDTRHQSRHFAELCAEIMAANDFEVLMFDSFRPTPELSFAVRHFRCDCGIMISASHNPPSDNAIKAFWSTGGQLRPPHDEGVMQCVARVTTIKRVPFAEALAASKIRFIEQKTDPLYQSAVLAQGESRPRDLRILYSPLHGVGLTSVLPILRSDGFHQVEVFEPHATPDGDFPNVPNHVSNPENPAVFEAPIEHARHSGAELILASDPDADRIGCVAPITTAKPPNGPTTWGEWKTLTGNQIGVLIGEFLLRRLKASGRITPEHYVIKTLVTSDMICRVAEQFGIRHFGNVLTGFKWIGSLIDEVGPEKFVFGFEEAHGYLAGTYARDKDGAVAAMLLAELAAECKSEGCTLHEQLDRLFIKYGCHLEKTISLTMPGADGMTHMKAIMEGFRAAPPRSLGGMSVRLVRDYLLRQAIPLDASAMAAKEFDFSDVPASDLLIFDLSAPGNRAAVRPSGTEPKIKFYLFASKPPEQSRDLPATKKRLLERLAALESDFLSAANSIG